MADANAAINDARIVAYAFPVVDHFFKHATPGKSL
jgi:hypothetical protein